MQKLFDPNDYDEIYNTYFSDLVNSGSVVSDPSGWAFPEMETAFPFATIQPTELSRYLIDNRKLIESQKVVLLRLLSEWDRTGYTFNQVTIMPSISTASLAVLLLLRRQGVKTIFFETPAYFVTIDQAIMAGIRPIRIPTYHDNQYSIDISSIERPKKGAIALWLTQPRFMLGRNQDPAHVATMYKALQPEDFLIIDETADQAWPTVLSALNEGQIHANIFKIRGYMKPLGLNALRICFVIHDTKWRPAIQELQWTVGGALDSFSLSAAVQIADSPAYFRSMLISARTRVYKLRQRLGALTQGSHVTLSPMENGYLGAAIVDWNTDQSSYTQKRQGLLELCRAKKMPITLGAAMYFASDFSREHVRLNYFMSEKQLIYCVEALTSFE